MHSYTKNEPVIKRNKAIPNNLPDKFYTIRSDDKVVDNIIYPLATVQDAKIQNQTYIGALAKTFKLEIDAKSF